MATTPLWHDAIVASFRDVTPTVREFSIRPEGDAQGVAQSYEPGSHLQLQILVNNKPHTRSYSLVGQPDASCYRIFVKRLRESRSGSKGMWRLFVGDRLHTPHRKTISHRTWAHLATCWWRAELASPRWC